MNAETSLDAALSAARLLAREPLARIMYGQRELFHSNLLAWFFEEFPAEADEVFKLFSTPGGETSRAIKREFQNLDLVMLWPGRSPLVIENKVFALPDPIQLERYDEVLAKWKNLPQRVLLGVVPPLREVDGWRFVSYRDLAERIEHALVDRVSTYEVETMRHYARMIHRLVDLIEVTEIHTLNEDVWLAPELLAALDSNQLATALSKLRGHRVAADLNIRLGGGVDASLSHGKPVLTWRRNIERDGFVVEAGLQLQEGQLRRYLTVPHLSGRTADHISVREEFAARHLDDFRFGGLGAAIDIDQVVTVPAIGFLRFNPDFVYRYAKVSVLSAAQLEAAIRWADASLQP